MRIGLAQINPTLGHFKENRDKILEMIERAQGSDGCDLLVFPEATLFGYHPFDLLERRVLVRQQLSELQVIEKKLPLNFAVVLGIITENENPRGRPYRNSAVVLQKNKKPIWFHKLLLPTGDVFDEARFIEPGSVNKNFFRFGGKKFFLTICEDIWAWPDIKGESFYADNPLAQIKEKGIDCILNLSASPFYPAKLKHRELLVAQTAKKLRAPMVYCNLIGAQDEIIFDGQSFVLNAKGEKILSLKTFAEDLQSFELEDVKKMRPIRAPRVSEIFEIRQALILGIHDFCRKTKNSKVHLGLSGGIDSAVVACLAAEAVGAENVKAIALPTAFNHSDSLRLAEELATNLKIELIRFPIQKSYEHLKKEIDETFGIQSFGLVHENLQARIRGILLMAYSNHQSSLLLGTSNKSELATGFGTLYGDMIGALLPIGDLTKSRVRALANEYNRTTEIIPQWIIDRPPSAELRAGQKDEDRLPAYEVLDEAVENIVTRCKPLKTETEHWLMKQIFASEFKRWQAPPILKVSAHSFGRGRRWPVAHQANE